MLISMNYENSYEYLCFCCVDAVDCCCQNQDLQDWDDAGASLGVLPCITTAPLDCGSSPQ